MKRALLVALPYLLNSEERVQPVALCYLAAYANAADREIHLLDLNIHANPLRLLEDHLRRRKYDVVGLSFFNQLPMLRSPTRLFKGFCRAVRNHHRGCLIAGGPTFTLLAERVISEVHELDLGIVGDGEPSFVAVLNGQEASTVPGAIYRDPDGTVRTNPRVYFDMKDLPACTNAPGLNLGDYEMIGVQYKRGCAHACHFCSGPYIRGRGPRKRPMETVLNELESYIERGKDRFLFVDPVFNEPLNECKLFLRKVSEQHLSMKWSGLIRPEFVDLEFVELAKMTGCFSLEISADYGTEAGLKQISTGKTLADVKRAWTLIHNRSEIQTLSYFLFGYPGIPIRERWKSYRFIAGLDREFPSQAKVFLSPLRPFPHSPIAKQLGKKADSLIFRFVNTFSDIHFLLYVYLSFNCITKAVGTRLSGWRLFRRGGFLKRNNTIGRKPGDNDHTR